MINDAICNFLEDKDCDINIQECFDEIFSGICSPLLSGIFLALLKTQEYSEDDLVSAINSARNAIKQYHLNTNSDLSIENICIDQKAEYIDISFATDIICCACNIGIVKSIPANYMYKNHSFDTLKSFKINIDNFSVENFEQNNFLYGYISEDDPYVKYTKELYRTIPFETILNKINYFLNPYNVKNCAIAVCNKDNVEKYAKICLKLNYSNSIVYSSGDFPYVSIEKETFIAEAWKNKIFSYGVSPELLGVKQNSLESVKVENAQHNFEIIKNVFENKIKDSYYDIIVINSGLSLYITKHVPSLMEGIDLARKTIDDKIALEKLNSLIKYN